MGVKCSRCLKPAPGCDRLPQRSWLFVPLWGIVTWFRYAGRRVHCPEPGVVIEHVPWSEGKRPVRLAMLGFLSRWARRLSWRETARVFGPSWEGGYRSVAGFVEWGLGPRMLAGIKALGVDEIRWGRGRKREAFLTGIDQLAGHCRRRLWVGRQRTQAPLNRGLDALGREGVSGLKSVCRDLWKPHWNVLARQAGQALHILDRCHVTMPLNQAVDQVRRAERPRLTGQPLAKRRKKMHWKLLRKGSRVRGRAKLKLEGLFARKLAPGRAWDWKAAFQHFGKERGPVWAGGCLDYWTQRAMRRRLEPMQKAARMLRAHEPLIVHGFKAKGEAATGATEGLNNRIRVVTRRADGFRTDKAMETALYHNLGKLPEPQITHKFC
jgi:transposase